MNFKQSIKTIETETSSQGIEINQKEVFAETQEYILTKYQAWGTHVWEDGYYKGDANPVDMEDVCKKTTSNLITNLMIFKI